MLILLVLMLLAPALLSVLLFEQFKGTKLPCFERASLLLVFSSLINMLSYAALWLRGWSTISWTLDGASSMTNVSFCLKYMALSLVFAVALAFVCSLVKAGKRT